ncbi:hypothetical protein RCO27_16155 [Sphingosinicella sp. LHD-64]|uniref:hypothetical protein n=1 Tax=Sphingosinicella sp. LHD-64 TaxID=3072139 RepID=UPI00280EE003|nr:hypothetical protein [Sphingosinicella sp. LHD-64]MDQ8757761.1 hypothetical protein [Sphingosinicella sp. LHD-64]
MASAGRTKTFFIDFTLGTGFNFGTTPRLRLPLSVGLMGATGTGLVFSNGAPYVVAVQCPPSTTDVYPYSALNSASAWTTTSPNTWVSGDSGNFTVTMEYEYTV